MRPDPVAILKTIVCETWGIIQRGEPCGFLYALRSCIPYGIILVVGGYLSWPWW